MQKHVAIGTGATLAIGLIGLLAGQFAKPPEAFDFNRYEGVRLEQKTARDRSQRSEVAPPKEPEKVVPGELESSIRDNLVSYGLQSGIRR
jgi:hypothetical protein